MVVVRNMNCCFFSRPSGNKSISCQKESNVISNDVSPASKLLQTGTHPYIASLIYVPLTGKMLLVSSVLTRFPLLMLFCRN